MRVKIIIFIISTFAIILISQLIIQFRISKTEQGAFIVNLSGRQRMLSQRIYQYIIRDTYENFNTVEKQRINDSLKVFTRQWTTANSILYTKNEGIFQSDKIDSLLMLNAESIGTITEFIRKKEVRENLNQIDTIIESYLVNAENVVKEFEFEIAKGISDFRKIELLFATISVIAIAALFFFNIYPLLKNLRSNNRKLQQTNINLVFSEEKIKKSLEEIYNIKKKLEETNIKLHHRNSKLANFAHITSHDLRAPISNLNLLIGLYNDSSFPEEREIVYEKIEQSVKNLSDTLENLVRVIKITENTDIEIRKLSFHKILEETLQNISSHIEDSKAHIKKDFSEVTHIHYNHEYLKSIFLNLITNSIKYKSDERRPEIFIKSYQKNDGIFLEFSDNGLGIDLKLQGDKIFGLNKTFHKHKEARGVGLFIIRNQIESLDGSITVESEVNKGTKFSIKFKKL